MRWARVSAAVSGHRTIEGIQLPIAGASLPASHIEVADNVTADTHYVLNNVVTAYSAPELAAYQARPEGPATWNVVSKAWEGTEPLSDRKVRKKAEMKCNRQAEEFSTFTYDGNEYDCDEVATQRIMGAVQLAILADLNNQPFSIDWTLADDSVVTLDGADMIAVGQALAAHVNDKHDKYRQKVTAIDNAPNQTALDAITW